MSMQSALGWPRPTTGVSYAVAVLTVVVAALAAHLFSSVLDTNPIVSLFLCGILFVAWYGGAGPATLAAAMSVATFAFFFVSPAGSFAVPLKEVPRVGLFALAAAFVVLLSSAQRSAAESLRRTRDRLRLAVQNLERANKALEAESAERKRSEEEVRRAERALQATLDTMPALVATFGPNGERESLNLTACTYAGLSLQDVRRGTAWTAFHPDDHKALDQKWQTCLAEGKTLQLDVRFLGADGTYRWHLLRRVARRDETGRIVKWYGVAFDIEDQKRAETALRQSEAYLARAQGELRQMIDSIPTLAATYWPDGTRDFVNKTWQDYMGLTLADVKGKQWDIAVHPDDLEEGDKRWRACLRTGEPFAMNARYRRGDGEYRWLAVTRVPLRDEKGGIVKWYAVSHDIEDQRRAEDALRRSEAYLADAQRLSHTGTFGWKTSSQEIYWSDEMYRIFACDPSFEPTIDLVLQRVHPDDVELVHRQTERASREGADIDFEHRLLMPDASIKHLRVVTRSTVDAAGTREIVGAVMDITETKRAQEALHVAQAELAHATRITTLGQLTASIAHEVSQPLVGIVTNGDAGLRWLERDEPDVDEASRALKRIVDDAERASNVIRRIRDLAKKAVPEMVRVDINDIIEDVILLLHRQAISHRATLRLELAPGLAAVLGDRVQLQQVIINLVMNGIEAMDEVKDRPRELVVRSQPYQDGQILVAVRDTGVGFEPAVADRLFSPFYTTKTKGMGMGLSICRSIVEAHGGRVWATNNEGPGATIQFTLRNFNSPH